MIHRHDDRRPQAPTRRQLYAACLLALTAFGGAGTVHAQSGEAPRAYAIDAGSLENALNQLARQSQVQIVFRPELVAGKRATSLSGRLTWREALALLLDGSGLDYRQVADRTIVIQASEPATAPATNPPAQSSPPPPAARAEPRVTDVETMTVTGTRIRGGSTPSPVITIGSENIQQEGFTDLGQVIRAVPQNFTGGQNPGVLMGNVAGGGLANQNVTGGSGLNLRGLGPDASLTLLSGRRLAYGGFVQSVDISAIPVEAVERVEIVADGASAIYGSDAVGGVANVVLKRDFEGVALSARYGAASDGGLATHEYTGTAGTTWGSGGLIATYKTASTDPIYARQRDYTDQLPEPTTIYPGSDLRSGLVSIHQSFGEAVEFRLDAFKTKREQHYNYYFSSETTYNELTPRTTTSFASPSIEFMLPNDWTLTVAGAWGRDEYRNVHQEIDVATGAATPYLNECFCNRSRSYEIGAEGSVFGMAGGEARVAIGAGYRTQDFLWNSLVTGAASAQGTESSRFAYAEMYLPLIGVESGIVGARRLEVTVAARSEDYSSFGHVVTPKLGLIYDPNTDVTLKASWGRSYKAPTLFQRYSGQYALLDIASFYGAVDAPEDATIVYAGGGNPDLDAERARTWTASLSFHPQALPSLEAELTWFGIDYTDRVLQPITTTVGLLTDPVYAEFVTHAPTVEQQDRIIAQVDTFYNFTDGPYDPNSVVAIIDGRYVNATRQKIKGIDLSASYRFDVGAGSLTIRGSGSWLDSSQQTAGMPAGYDLAGTLHNPARFNSRIGTVWSQGGFSASAFANHVGGVRNRADGVKGASFTTIDMTLLYETLDGSSVWSGLQLALTVSNLLDRDPPLYTPDMPGVVAPYDSTNYSAIGRLVSLTVSKRW